jgi:hypothetical protein
LGAGQANWLKLQDTSGKMACFLLYNVVFGKKMSNFQINRRDRRTSHYSRPQEARSIFVTI